MFITTKRLGGLAVSAGLLTLFVAAPTHADAPSTAGVARISDVPTEPVPPEPASESVMDEPVPADGGDMQRGCACGDPTCGSTPCDGGMCFDPCFDGCRSKKLSQYKYIRDIQLQFLGMGEWCNGQADNYYTRNNRSSKTMAAYLRCKFGYFLPTGCCGAGCPLVGSYGTVYSVNPQYFDERDGKLYGAQGYGTPMAVPLAPTVRYTYNYGWGYPSSRLTPISNVNPVPYQ